MIIFKIGKGPQLILTIWLTGLLSSGGCTFAQRESHDFAGKWRGEFIIRDGVAAPFNFEIQANGKVYLLNAEERFETGSIIIIKDSLFIPLDQFDNELAFAIHNKQTLTGTFRKQDHTGPPVPVKAEKGKLYRFPEKNIPPAKNISGRYDLDFKFENGRIEKAVAILKQEGNKLSGTFLKPAGDTRFLEGVVQGNNFYLSSFIGSSPGYYYGSFTNDGKISGAQLGTRIRNTYSGIYNENAALPDPYKVSQLKEGFSSLDFSLPDNNGNNVSLKDEKYQNKVVIIAITGTWCPNCIDEANFLSPWYKKNNNRGVEIITIHYERQSDTAYAGKVMRRFRQRFDITYDQLFGGISHKDTVMQSLRGLEGFNSFPTTIFIDKKGNVTKIHTGYTGPATGKFYGDFVKEFNGEVDRLLGQ